MIKKYKCGVFLTCIALCLAGCGSSTQATFTVNDSKPAEEEETTNDSSEVVEEDDAESETDDAESETDDSESETIQNDTKDISVAEAAKAYADYLKGNNREDFDMLVGSAGLIHLDDDEIPELAYCTGTAHPNGILFYSYDGNYVRRLGGYGSFGCACYEYRKGTMYGYYSGMGSTFDRAGVENNGKLMNEYSVVITDIESADPSAVEGGYRYAITDDDFNDTEITREEYERIITPFLIENRDYTLLADEYLIKLHDIDDIEEALIKSLDSEGDYPKVTVDSIDTDYFSSRVTPED